MAIFDLNGQLTTIVVGLVVFNYHQPLPSSPAGVFHLPSIPEASSSLYNVSTKHTSFCEISELFSIFPVRRFVSGEDEAYRRWIH
jgi:hypothetical protein